jgi:hypothetical protein
LKSTTRDLGECCTARDTLALAVTGLVIAEKCSDQLRMNMGGGHSKSLRPKSRDARMVRVNSRGIPTV